MSRRLSIVLARVTRATIMLGLPVSVAACGGGPKLVNLRCRDAAHCQHQEDPFRLLLAVDFTDTTGTLSKGALALRVDGNTQTLVSIKDLFTRQGLDPTATTGTLDIDDQLVLDRAQQNQQISVSVVGTDGAGQNSNEPKLSFTLHLGTSP